jgi:hypothetical protein
MGRWYFNSWCSFSVALLLGVNDALGTLKQGLSNDWKKMSKFRNYFSIV